MLLAASAASLFVAPAVASPPGCATQSCTERVKAKAYAKTHGGCYSRTCTVRVRAKHQRRVVAPYEPKLERMAACESGGNWSINTGNGFYGGLQFAPATWYGVGGRGMPHHASELEQKYRAVLLIRRAGYGPWPVCGRR